MKDLTKRAGGGFDVIIDSAAGPGFEALVDAAAPGGRIVFYGGTQGPITSLTPGKVFWKQLSILVGALKAQQPTVSLSPFALQANEFVEAEEIEGVAKESSHVPANASPLVLQFFQVCAPCL